MILIGSGNLYQALNDTVVRTCIYPNKLPEVTSEHNLDNLLLNATEKFNLVMELRKIFLELKILRLKYPIEQFP